MADGMDKRGLQALGGRSVDSVADEWAEENPELARQLEEMLTDEEKLNEYLELDSEVGNTIV